MDLIRINVPQNAESNNGDNTFNMVDNSFQQGQPVNDDIDEIKINELKIFIRELLRNKVTKRVSKSKRGQSRNVQDDMSTPLDTHSPIFNAEVSYLTDSTGSGRQRFFDLLNDITPKKHDLLTKGQARRYLGWISNEIFEHYIEEGFFLRHKYGKKNVYYRYELREFLKSGKRLSAHDEGILNKKLKAANDKDRNTKKLF